jgi:protein-L-isoaspartate(D-aspartate) O-methyltransferase
MLDLARQRRQMIDLQVAGRGIANPLVLEAMRRVPRERFVSPGLEEFAYEDSPLPIEVGQTISQPYIVAVMIDAAAVQAGHRVLEIGTGSGYAAAVLSQIAKQVYTVERHPELAEQAKKRFRELGYENIQVRVGDGTVGWPEAAPFDAILGTAAGPAVPKPLREQLAVGGRLIMPVGDTDHQRLIRLRRVEPDIYEEDDLGDVRFVPMIGEHGWSDDEQRSSQQSGQGGETVRARQPEASELVRAAAEPLPDFDDPAFGRMFDRFADARVVLLGEASHGTSEFYRARAAITRHLIERHGFSIVAVEADWPDAAAIDRYVRHKTSATMAEQAFRRFPTWMWRNTDVDAFVRWLRSHNAPLPPSRQTGFYGLDLYNLSASIRAVLSYLDKTDPEAAKIARERYGCLTPWQNEPQTYGRMAISSGFAKCEPGVVRMLNDLLKKEMEYRARDSEGFLDAVESARLVRDAEAYYRAMYFGSAESWNLRDRHMFETLEHLLDFKGAGAKAVVWAHNSHIGDASFTEMGRVREEINIGQLCREKFGDAATLIGFGTHTGTVAAAADWDGPMEVKRVVPSRPDSYERVAHNAALPRFLIDLREGKNDDARRALLDARLERFIGVIYRPETERLSHYSSAQLPNQFDAYVWFDWTRAVTPLPAAPQSGEEETYPFGL